MIILYADELLLLSLRKIEKLSHVKIVLFKLIQGVPQRSILGLFVWKVNNWWSVEVNFIKTRRINILRAVKQQGRRQKSKYNTSHKNQAPVDTVKQVLKFKIVDVPALRYTFQESFVGSERKPRACADQTESPTSQSQRFAKIYDISGPKSETWGTL